MPTVADLASGWPAAFDPFGTLQWLARARPDRRTGSSWYTATTAGDLCGSGRHLQRRLRHQDGPVAEPRPPGGNRRAHVHLPEQLVQVRHGACSAATPTTTRSSFFGERPAFLVTDPNTAGVYDTIYVDLNDDYDFSDEKPVTKESPRSWRDLDGDGYVDLSGGMAYYISDGTGPTARRFPAAWRTSVSRSRASRASCVAWTGDFDPGLERPRHVVRQQHRRPGRDQRQPADLLRHPRRQVPSRRRRRRAATRRWCRSVTSTSAFDFSTQFAYLLSNEHGIDVTSNSYGSSDEDNDGLDASSQEADIWHTAFGGRTTPLYSSGNGAPGFGTVTPPSPVVGHQGRRLDAVRRHRLGLDQAVQPGQRQRRGELVEPRTGVNRRHRHRPGRRRRLLARLDELVPRTRGGQTARTPGRPGVAPAVPRRWP